MRVTRKITGIAGLAAASLLLAGCSTVAANSSTSTTSDKSGRITLAGVASNTSDPFWLTLQCGATQEAKKLGATITWKSSTGSDTSQQQTNFDAALLTKPDALIIGAIQPSQFGARVKTLMSQGMPVVSVATPLQPDTSLQTVESDPDETAFAKLIAQSVGDTGTVAVLGGVTGTWSDGRVNPVVDAIKKASPQVTVLPTQYTGFDINKSTSIIAGLLLAHPDLKAVYTPDGPEGQGAAAAIAQANKTGTVKLFTWDATPANTAALKSGAITAVLSAGPATIGAKGVDIAVAQVKRKSSGAVTPTTKRIIPLPTMILTKSNLDSAQAKDFLYSATCSS